MEDIVKLGAAASQVPALAGGAGGDATKGLVGESTTTRPALVVCSVFPHARPASGVLHIQ